jgi:glycogen operon protein
MILGGDELGRTQCGNNNAYSQDSELTWYDWSLDDDREALLAFTRRVIALRARHPVFRRTRFFAGEPDVHGLPDVWWFRPDGRRMARRDWDSPNGHHLGIFVNGRSIHAVTPHHEPVIDDSFLILFNAHHDPVRFTLPSRRFGTRWLLELSTAQPERVGSLHAARSDVSLDARSLVVLRRGV